MKFFNDKFLTERLDKEFYYFKMNDSYRPDYYKSAVTSKFYSQHDCLDLSTADDELVTTIKMYRDKGPKDKFPWPATENQTYGWFNTLLVPLKKEDERYYHGVCDSDLTRHALLLMNDRSLKLEKFTGVPFKLQ